MKIRSTLLCAAAATAVIAGGAMVSPASAGEPVYGGFYFGITGGYATGEADISAILAEDHNVASAQVSEDGKADLDGGMIGGLAGYDYNIGNGLVIGVLGDISWSDVEGGSDVEPSVMGVSGSDYSMDSSLAWLGTARARIGFEMGNALIYGTGGIAFGGLESDLSVAGDGRIASDSSTEIGWTAGAGINLLASENVMLGLEYLYVGFEETSFDFGQTGHADVDFDMHLVRGSLSFKF
jgi:outer membrane immunogenic protein